MVLIALLHVRKPPAAAGGRIHTAEYVSSHTGLTTKLMAHLRSVDHPSRQGQVLHLALPRGLPKQRRGLNGESATRTVSSSPPRLNAGGLFRWGGLSRP